MLSAYHALFSYTGHIVMERSLVSIILVKTIPELLEPCVVTTYVTYYRCTLAGLFACLPPVATIPHIEFYLL